MAVRLTSFQKLALWTTAATYFLIFVGGLVRASGAGLGCPDWPLCFGGWIPPLSAEQLPPEFDAAAFNPTLMWTEYLNRVLGVVVGLLIFATLVSAVRQHRRTSRILWPTVTAFLLVGFQGWLGGVVVQEELATWIVTVHLLVALVIVTLLLYATVYSFLISDAAERRLRKPRRALTRSLVVLIAITLGQVALGTEVRGGVDQALAQGVARSSALGHVGAVDLWHRETALLVVAASMFVVLLVARRHRHEPRLLRTMYVMTALVVLQVALGVAMAYVALTPAVQVAHLTAASLLLGAETILYLFARWLPAPDPRA